jgi:hypothetical protein
MDTDITIINRHSSLRKYRPVSAAPEKPRQIIGAIVQQDWHLS